MTTCRETHLHTLTKKSPSPPPSSPPKNPPKNNNKKKMAMYCMAERQVCNLLTKVSVVVSYKHRLASYSHSRLTHACYRQTTKQRGHNPGDGHYQLHLIQIIKVANFIERNTIKDMSLCMQTYIYVHLVWKRATMIIACHSRLTPFVIQSLNSTQDCIFCALHVKSL